MTEISRPSSVASKRPESKEQIPSFDDEARDWNFEAFTRIVNEIEPSSASVGSIMAAMVYQIEQ